MDVIHTIRNQDIGLALSGGGVRGIAHIGVWKALSEAGIMPSAISGTSAGSIIGACIAAGMHWQDIAAIARTTFWPSLLHGKNLELFCCSHLPRTFDELQMPFAVVVTSMHDRKPLAITEGDLASAINASCSMPVIRPMVDRNGLCLKDGGISCVIPSQACRNLGAEFVIASDVWAYSAFLRRFGIGHDHIRSRWVYPKHYFNAVEHADLLIEPNIPIQSHVPGHASIDRLMNAGALAAIKAITEIDVYMTA